MKIENIQEEWNKDSGFTGNVSHDILKIPELHNKYYKILTNERLILKKYEADMKILRKEKQEFYIDGNTEETLKKKWELPAKGRIIKTEVAPYLDSDSDIIELSLKIGMQIEKVDFVENIIKHINNRGYLLRTFLDSEKFRNGVN